MGLRNDSGRGPAADAKAWLVDEQGRKYREDGGARVYQVREERDAAADESYVLSAPIRSVLAEGEPLFQGIAGEVSMLAELFHAEQRGGRTLDERIDMWTCHHFGRQLEPALRGMLKYEIRRTMAVSDGGRRGPAPSIYSSHAEQRAFERAASEPGLVDLDTLERCARIAEQATGRKRVKLPKGMPAAREGRDPGQEG